jgi:outer membrane protein assembly factor BamA
MHFSPHLQAAVCATGFSLSALAFAPASLAQTPTPSPNSTATALASAANRYAFAPLPDATPTPTSTQLSNLGDRAKNFDRNAPRRENITGINVGVKYVNAILGGFEQGAGFPFGVEFTTADTIPGIELRARALTSTRFYRKAELGAYIPKIGSEKTRAELWFAYQRRTRDHFFGLGSRTPQSNETNADIEMRSYNAYLAHDITKNLEIGGYVRVSNTATYTGQNEDEPPIGTLFTGSPGVGAFPPANYVPGLFTNVKTAGFGGYLELNARNDSAGLTRGGYGYVRVGKVEGLEINPFTPSNYSWTEAELDGRAYIPLGSNKTSLALRAYADLRDPSNGDQIPFYEQPWLGGRNHLRGYQNFRFRANNLLLLIGELRQTVWAQKEDRGVDVFVFVDNGKIWGDSRSVTNPAITRNDKFGDQPWRVGPGGGFQFRYNKSTAVRFDIGKTNERTMVYFSVSRGF